MWEEYIIPLIVIAFVAGIVIGINITMLCSQRLTNNNNNPVIPYTHRTVQQQQPLPHHQQHAAPMQYPQGFHQHPNYINSELTTTELTANDFSNNRYKGMTNNNGRRRSNNNNGGLNYG